jgi:hypothetical protein
MTPEPRPAALCTSTTLGPTVAAALIATVRREAAVLAVDRAAGLGVLAVVAIGAGVATLDQPQPAQTRLPHPAVQASRAERPPARGATSEEASDQ